MGNNGLHLVKKTDDDQGTWGVYEHIAPLVTDGLALSDHVYIFPNRTVPDAQISSRGVGWDATTSWLIEWQCWLPSGSTLQLMTTADADVDIHSPDFFYLTTLYASGDMIFRWDNRSGQSLNTTASNVITPNRWHHIALQKNADDTNVRVYIDGLLVLTVDVPSKTNFDELKFAVYDGEPRVRELSVRTLAAYPTVPFTPGVVSFASAMGNLQHRWNSYMLG